MSFVVPWGSLGVIFLVVYLVALATTFAPRTARLARVPSRGTAVPIIRRSDAESSDASEMSMPRVGAPTSRETRRGRGPFDIRPRRGSRRGQRSNPARSAPGWTLSSPRLGTWPTLVPKSVRIARQITEFPEQTLCRR